VDWERHFQRVSSRKRHTVTFGADFGLDPSVLKEVQQKLNDLGADPPLVVDGVAGHRTTSVVKQFQAINGLTVDGVIGPQTLNKLGVSTGGMVEGIGKVATAAISIEGLKDAVVNAFASFSQTFEGAGTNFMYTDSKGYVTTGIGNLIDPLTQAMGLPWKRLDGSLATQQEIVDAWTTVKNAWPAVQSYASKSLTSLRLDADGMSQVVARKVKGNHEILRTQYPGYVNWPADAQLALHSISWAWGPGFANVWGQNGHEFKNAVNQPKPDFVRAADVMSSASKHEESINPGIVPRNIANKKLFVNAADVQAKRANYNKLFYPGVVVVSSIFGLLMAIGMGVFGYFGWENYKKTGKVWPL
jgi:hypothetical protein